MSLLDDVSIVVTPNGYKAGELYAVVPVPTEGAELVTNGDFATDSDWTKETGWTISGGSANCTGASGKSIYQTNTLIVGRQYKLNFTLSNYSTGYLGSFGNDFGGVMAEANGTYEIIGTSTGTTFGFVAQGTFTGSVDNVSVKEYTAADMDVTRATAGTRVDEDGLVNYAEVIGSEEVTNGDFTNGLTGFSTQIPSGQTVEVTSNQLHVDYDSTATQGSTGVNQTILTAGKQYKITIDVASITGTFRVQAGGQVQDINTSGIHTFYKTPTSSILYIIRQSNAASCEFRLNSVSVKEVTRDNVPRIDYTGGGCPHILAEPQRTNLITYSEDFSQSYWTKQSGVTPTYNTTETLSPDGTYNATKFIGNGSSGVLKGGISVTGVITRSVYLKSITGTVNVVLKDPNLTVTQKNLTVTDEWQRFELIESNGTSTQGIWIDDIPASGIYMWAASLELGSYATSYIPTSGSTVTRNQDIFTRDGIGSLINSTEGVLFIEMAVLSADTINRYISLSNGTDDNSISFHFRNNSNNQVRVILKSGNSNQFDATYNPSGSTDFAKVAFKYKVNDFALWVNGTEIATDTSGITFSADTLNRLAFDDGNGNSNLYGKVKQLQVYKTALTDAQLTSLTT